MSKVIRIGLINAHYYNLLANYFKIKKTYRLVIRKKQWLALQQNTEVYFKDCNIYIIYKAVCYMFNGNLQLLLVHIYY